MKNNEFGSKKEVIFVNSITSLRFIASFFVIPIFKIAGGLSAALFSTIFLLTDAIDGFLARKLKSSTFFGALFDGLTDKTYGIIAFLLLMSINPIAFSIPLLIEISIILVQNKKLKNNKNIQSNKIGKIKTWFLGLSIVGSFAAVDLLNMPPLIDYIKYSSLDKVAFIKNTFTLLGIEFPMLITQLLTLKSYNKEAIQEESNENENILIKENKTIEQITTTLHGIQQEKEQLQQELKLLEKTKILMNAMLDPEYYNQNKDMPIRTLKKELFHDKRLNK